MEESALATLCRATAGLRAWIDSLANSTDLSAQRAKAIDHLSQILRTVDSAVQSAPQEITAAEEWRIQLALYKDTLRELRTQLAAVETALRVRSAEISRARTRASAVDAWAKLVRHVG